MSKRVCLQSRKIELWTYVVLLIAAGLGLLFLSGCDSGWEGKAALNCEQFEDGTRDIACVQDYESGRRR